MNRISINGFYSATEWITKFAYINLLWIGFSIVGLLIFGFFPATVSLFTVVRKWLMGERDIPIFRTFLDTYKKEFIKSNLLGLIVMFTAGLIVLDFVYMKSNGTSLTKVIHIPLYMFIFIFALTTLYLFPVYVHYDLKLLQLIKNSFFMILINPISTLVIIISGVTIFFVLKFIPGLGFFFGGSLTAASIMAASYTAFKKIDQKRNQLNT
jgi:uncharacterized membrane protein YesL